MARADVLDETQELASETRGREALDGKVIGEPPRRAATLGDAAARRGRLWVQGIAHSRQAFA